MFVIARERLGHCSLTKTFGAVLRSQPVSDEMKQRYRVFRRGWGTYYYEDTETGQQQSLQTRDKYQARTVVHTMNEAQRQPMLNLQIARAYLRAADSTYTSRTWQWVMDQSGEGKNGATKARWLRGMADRAFDPIRELKLIETKAEDLLAVLKAGTVSTNIFLRRLHNYALDMNWLMAPIIPRRQWRPIKFQEKRAITLEEHQKVIADERNDELRAYYELLWHLGGSQTDVATLSAEDVNWKCRTLSYARVKSGSNAIIRFGENVARILQSRPKKGLLFPRISAWKESDRAKAFSRRRTRAGVSGVTLHSYRYAWAERALAAGYPERYAQQALGHRSRAVHSAYSRRAHVEIPPLEDFEQREPASNLIDFPASKNSSRSSAPKCL